MQCILYMRKKHTKFATQVKLNFSHCVASSFASAIDFSVITNYFSHEMRISIQTHTPAEAEAFPCTFHI